MGPLKERLEHGCPPGKVLKSRGEHPDYAEPCLSVAGMETRESVEERPARMVRLRIILWAGIIATDGDRLHRPLRRVVVDLQEALLRVPHQRRPVVQRVADRLADRALGQHLRSLRLQPGEQLLQDRHAIAPAQRRDAPRRPTSPPWRRPPRRRACGSTPAPDATAAGRSSAPRRTSAAHAPSSRPRRSCPLLYRRIIGRSRRRPGGSPGSP